MQRGWSEERKTKTKTFCRWWTTLQYQWAKAWVPLWGFRKRVYFGSAGTQVRRIIEIACKVSGVQCSFALQTFGYVIDWCWCTAKICSSYCQAENIPTCIEWRDSNGCGYFEALANNGTFTRDNAKTKGRPSKSECLEWRQYRYKRAEWVLNCK